MAEAFCRLAHISAACSALGEIRTFTTSPSGGQTVFNLSLPTRLQNSTSPAVAA